MGNKHHHELAIVQRQPTRGRRKSHHVKKPSAWRVAELRGRGLQGYGRDMQAVLGHNRSVRKPHWGI